MTSEAGLSRTLELGQPIDLRATLSPLRHGRSDPSVQILRTGSSTVVWRATRTPEGPATTRIAAEGARAAVTMHAWGPGALWCLGRLPDLVGADAVEPDLAPDGSRAAGRSLVASLARRFAGVRIGRSEAVMEALVPAVLEQKVVGLDAKRSHAGLVRRLGDAAPGPGADRGLLVPPAPAVLARTSSAVFHLCGVERKRADTIRRACGYAARLEQVAALSRTDAYRRLTALPGLGPWTAAEVARVALGDIDAVSIGDYHLPDRVAWALAGEARADDARMLELLDPWRGRRAFVVRLIELGAPAPPRFGPRLARPAIAHL